MFLREKFFELILVITKETYFSTLVEEIVGDLTICNKSCLLHK